VTKSYLLSVLNDVNVRCITPLEAIVHMQLSLPGVCDDVSTSITPVLVPLDGWHRHGDDWFVDEHVTVAVGDPEGVVVGAGVVVVVPFGVVVVVRGGVVVVGVVVVGTSAVVLLAGCT